MVQWKIVPGLPYEVSDEGQVRRIGKTKCLTPMLTGKKRRQYATVSLCLNGTEKRYKVHRLVCELFNGPSPSPDLGVLHRDDDATNNRASNLYWGTVSDNAKDVAKRKVNAGIADEIRRRRAAGEKGAALAREFGISPQLICDIVMGRCYWHV